MTRCVSVAVIIVLMFILIPLAALTNSGDNEVHASNNIVSCKIVGPQPKPRIVCKAGGVVVLNQVISLPPPVTIPPVTVPGGPTIHLPGPTVTVPGPTHTVTNNIPGPTHTTTITRTPQPSTAPTVTVTETKTPASGQSGTNGGTIEPPSNDGGGVVRLPEIILNFPQALGIGAATVTVVLILILIGMYSGYYMGYKDRGKKEANFLRSLLGK